MEIFEHRPFVNKLDTNYTLYENNIEYEKEQHNKDNYSELEWEVLKNDVDKVIIKLSQGNKIYHSTKNYLCNGIYLKKTGKHPKKCNPSVCYRTAIYYALKNNCRAYMTICRILLELQEHIVELRKPCLCCKQKISEQNNYINSFLDGINSLKCDCSDKLQYNDYYDTTFLNFNYVHSLMCMYMPNIIRTLDYLNKEHITTLLKLESYENCIHHILKLSNKRFCKKIAHINYNKKAVSNLINKLSNIYSWYITNSDICIILFNQQMYEFYIHTLLNNTERIESIAHKLFDNDNLYIDINYVFENQNSNILEETINNVNNSKLINYLLKMNSKISNFSSIIEGIKKTHLESVKCVIKFLTKEQINRKYEGKNLFFLILTTNAPLKDKINILHELLKYGFNPNMTVYGQDIMSSAIQLTNSAEIAKNLIDYKFTPINKNHVELAIEKNNKDLIECLLDNYENKDDNSFVFSYINGDYLSSIIDVIINKNINIDKPYEGNYVFLYACKEGKINIVKKLILHNVNKYVVDSNKNTCLLLAIESNNYDICIEILDDKLINMQNNIGYTPLIQSIYTANPLKYIIALCKNKNINANICDNNKLTILDHLLNCNLETNIKKEILSQLLNHIDFTENKSIIVAVEKDYYEFTEIIFNYMINKKIIKLVDSDDYEYSLKDSFLIKNITIIPNFQCPINYYSLVYNYLKTNRKYNKKIEKDISHVIYVIMFIYNICICIMCDYYDKRIKN